MGAAAGRKEDIWLFIAAHIPSSPLQGSLTWWTPSEGTGLARWHKPCSCYVHLTPRSSWNLGIQTWGMKVVPLPPLAQRQRDSRQPYPAVEQNPSLSLLQSLQSLQVILSLREGLQGEWGIASTPFLQSLHPQPPPASNSIHSKEKSCLSIKEHTLCPHRARLFIPAELGPLDLGFLLILPPAPQQKIGHCLKSLTDG